MGYVVKDFECPRCGVTERVVDWGTTQLVCCGQTARALVSAPKVIGADSFNPHFDITQGAYFASPEQKRAWLASKDKQQMEGSLSPRISEHGRVVCSSDQAQQFRGRRARYIKHDEIPGLKLHNRRTSADSD